MCLLFVFINPCPGKNKYKLILVNVRDELYKRPTEKATIWAEIPKVIAGKTSVGTIKCVTPFKYSYNTKYQLLLLN